MSGFEFEGQRVEVVLDGEDVIIRCDRRTAAYIAVRLGVGSPLPVIYKLRRILDQLLLGAK
jgi:hypothetical protein